MFDSTETRQFAHPVPVGADGRLMDPLPINWFKILGPAIAVGGLAFWATEEILTTALASTSTGAVLYFIDKNSPTYPTTPPAPAVGSGSSGGLPPEQYDAYERWARRLNGNK